jgi:hypothetical protein
MIKIIFTTTHQELLDIQTPIASIILEILLFHDKPT